MDLTKRKAAFTTAADWLWEQLGGGQERHDGAGSTRALPTDASTHLGAISAYVRFLEDELDFARRVTFAAHQEVHQVRQDSAAKLHKARSRILRGAEELRHLRGKYVDGVEPTRP